MICAVQIQIYITEPNTAPDLVRTIVKDSSDGPVSSQLSFVFLDSNGLVNTNNSKPQVHTWR